jgi:alpha-L-fucosidase
MLKNIRCVTGVLSLIICVVILCTIPFAPVYAQVTNNPNRLEWFQDLGFGLFIHWSLDSQIGSVISHSLVGASDDYTKKFFYDLPQTFNPKKFDPVEWANLARTIGIKYVVFTTKHHSGFCMFKTATNTFNIMNTAYEQDITAQIVEAFRKQGIAIGFYFSPDDFYFLYKQGLLISRQRPEAQPINNKDLMDNNKQQVYELLTQYNPVDVMFYDGPAEGLKEYTWQLNPDVIITRGVLTTPEIAPSTGQILPDSVLIDPWEPNYTMATSWQYKPTNETYRSGKDLIQQLIETRAKGGNMLLNIGPMPNGEIPIEQENILREIGLWMFVNSEAVYDVRQWIKTNEDNIWFTKKKNEPTVFAFICHENWPWGKKKIFTLKSIKSTAKTKVSVLGQNNQVLEYQPEVVPKTSWRQDEAGLHIVTTRTQ